MKRRNYLIIIGIIAFIVVIGGISYSYFVYNKDIGDVTLNAGEISIDLSDVSQEQTLSNVIPKSDSEGMSDTNYLDFTVEGTVDSEQIYYEIYIMPDSNNTIDTSYIKTYLTDQEGNVIRGVNLYTNLQDSEIEGGKRIYRSVIEINSDYSKKTYSKDFRLRIWLDENYPETTFKTFNFDVKLYAKNVGEDYVIPEGEYLLRRAIKMKEADTNVQCSNITYEEDGITYLSGTNDCIDMNYVWYSGKLWRITAIYPDGATKLITQNNITTIAYNGDVNFYTDDNTTSYMYQWLNEDFYNTLYNASTIVAHDKQWIFTDSNGSSGNEYNALSAKLSNDSSVKANVGLLNSNEYHNGFRCTNNVNCMGTVFSSNYLINGYYWWLLNPFNSTKIWRVYMDGSYSGSDSTNSFGVRPSIVFNSNVEFEGDGTINSPFTVKGDKVTGNVNDLINTRLSGEYVKLDNGTTNQLFRIIGVEDNKTKIIAMDYADNGSTKQYATSEGAINSIWGNGTTTGVGTWYTYLNDSTSGYLSSLKTTYGELFDSGVYHLGVSGSNYKHSLCENPIPGAGNDCAKTLNVGLPRYGEMFAANHKGSSSTIVSVWLINQRTNAHLWYLGSSGYTDFHGPSGLYGANPTIHLKSTVKILSGSGTESDPYVVGL